jgi:hypothetical protein
MSNDLRIVVTARSARTLRPDHIRTLGRALLALEAIPADRRANLVTYLTTDDIITTREEREAGAAVLAALNACLASRRKK